MNVQLGDHDNDTEDVPESVDPLELSKKRLRGASGEPF